MKKVPLASPQIKWQERLNVDRVLRSKNLSQGAEVKKFEDNFSKFVEGRECVAVNSGTSALHLSLIALGVNPGDEIIVPSFTFAATVNAIVLAGAVPVFIDIDPRTYCINAEKIQDLITIKTKALIVVHLYGLPANMIEISKISKKYSLILIEDSAQAHLASINCQQVGTFGAAAIFSFYPTKNMTTGEGGMIVLADSKVARTCRLLRNQGMEKKYMNEIVGFNLRMTDIHAAIGICQLKKLPKLTDKRIQNAEFLKANLNTENLPYTPDGYKHVFHQFTVRIKNERTQFSLELLKEGIENSVYYPIPVHKLPSYNSKVELVETEKAANEVLSIPTHPNLTKNQLRKIVSAFNKTLESANYEKA
jgi:perosamine synthetase